jgi:2-keto-4-pentenoate hydratase/2-oxohepta-3-ene-1,7-dioic acid hydratase in catechol pathway
MKLVTFTHGGKTRIGAVVAEEIVDVSGQGRNVPSDMVAFLEQGAPALEQAREACASERGRLALTDVQLEAPIRRPPKILAVGLNYRDHIEETGRPMPEVPACTQGQSRYGHCGVYHCQ